MNTKIMKYMGTTAKRWNTKKITTTLDFGNNKVMLLRLPINHKPYCNWFYHELNADYYKIFSEILANHTKICTNKNRIVYFRSVILEFYDKISELVGDDYIINLNIFKDIVVQNGEQINIRSDILQQKINKYIKTLYIYGLNKKIYTLQFKTHPVVVNLFCLQNIKPPLLFI